MPRKKKLPELPPIPSKRYFPIREASSLCGVKDYVLRFWEKEFSQLRPMKRGSQRAYRAKDILIARRIRELLYGDGYRIDAAREILNKEDRKAKASASAPRFLSRGVAQPGSALAWGARGREFESRRPDQKFSKGCPSDSLFCFLRPLRRKSAWLVFFFLHQFSDRFIPDA